MAKKPRPLKNLVHESDDLDEIEDDVEDDEPRVRRKDGRGPYRRDE